MFDPATFLLLDLAFFNETNPNPDPAVNTAWARIRAKYDAACLSYQACSVCGTVGLCREYELAPICFEDECLKRISAT